jgi:taurine dioxygenase
MIKSKPLSDAGGVVVEGLDLSRPLTPELKAELGALFDAEGLLVLKDQTLTKRQLVDATYAFGEPEIHPLANAIDREVPEILVISTHGRDGDVAPADPDELVGRIDWHTDLAYVPVPNRGALIYGVVLPAEGGMTGFIDRQRTYAALPDRLKQRIEGLHVIQSWRYAQESIAKNPSFRTDEGAKMLELDRFPDLAHPLVYPHPVNGGKVLNVPPMWSSGIVELPGAEGRGLLDELIAHSLQERFVYWHRYAPGDLAIWDNWRMMHAASGTRGAHRRLMHRTTIKGSLAFGEPLDAAEMAAAQARVAAANLQEMVHGRA